MRWNYSFSARESDTMEEGEQRSSTRLSKHIINFCKIHDSTFPCVKQNALRGAETECAKLYHIYRDENFQPQVKVVVICKSKGYTLRPLFDLYENLIAFGYGYYLKEGTSTIEHFDIQTPDTIYRCKRGSL